MTVNLSELYPLTINVYSVFAEQIVKLTKHDISDWESPDVAWLEYTPEDRSSEGLYLSISRLSKESDLWYASLNEADRFGGHPTTWDESGSENELLGKIISLLKKHGNTRAK